MLSKKVPPDHTQVGVLPPIETGASVESRPRTRRESARLSFTGILSELRVLEACDFPLASSRWRGKASGAVAGSFAKLNGASPTSASRSSRAEPSAPLGRRRGGKSGRPTAVVFTARAAREAGWTLEAQLDSLDQRIKQQAREAAAKAAQDARRQAEREEGASQHAPVRRRLSVFGKLKVQAPEAAPVPAPAPAPKGIARELGRRARDNIIQIDNVDDGPSLAPRDDDGEGRAEAKQGSLSASMSMQASLPLRLDNRSRQQAGGIVDALRHQLVRQAVQVAPYRQMAQGRSGGGPTLGGARPAR